MASSVYQLFKDTAQTHRDKVAAQYKVAGAWRDVTWREIDTLAMKCAAGLVALGVEPKERVTILSNTRLEWMIADLGILGAGGTTVPIYQSNLPDEVQYILEDAGSVVVFAEDQEQLEKMRAIREQAPLVRKVVCFATSAVDESSDWEVSWEQLLRDGEKYLDAHREEVEARGMGLGPDDLLTLIYTSGTTGRPKGAMLTHDNMVYEAEAQLEIGLMAADDVQYLFLPMAHVFGKLIEIAWLATGQVLAFWEGDQAKIVENLGEVRPTMMASVPRIFEKVHAKVVGDVKSAEGFSGWIGRWALRKGDEAMRIEQEGGRPGGIGWWFARKLVWNKIGLKLGERFGGRLRFFISGGAPLGRDIAYFFKYAGVTICEGYGLTETAAGACVNRPERVKIGTVGPVLPGTELKIAEDGEILLRGRNIMRGYWNREDATREAIGEDGWFHTGDIGVVDGEGYVRITDRKKDIIVTAGGKNVAPQNIENTLKSASPLISQVVVHGDKRKFLSALITVDPDNLEDWAKDHGIREFDFTQVSQDDKLRREIDGVVNKVNSSLASYETLKKFAILDHDFEVGIQLTPTLKVKRKVCNERYKDILDGFYA
jgi:long-chain acyl-CoA synthetase